MKKQLTEKIVYEPRKGVKITVTNKPILNEDGGPIEYQRTVALTVDAGAGEKFAFANGDEMSDYFGNVDFEEPQQSLFANRKENE